MKISSFCCTDNYKKKKKKRKEKIKSVDIHCSKKSEMKKSHEVTRKAKTAIIVQIMNLRIENTYSNYILIFLQFIYQKFLLTFLNIAPFLIFSYEQKEYHHHCRHKKKTLINTTSRYQI